MKFLVPQQAPDLGVNGPLELAPAEVGIHDPAPECEGVIAA
jgi:hypothetical protein